MQLRILTAEDLQQALPMREVIQAMAGAYAQYSAGQAELPLRSRIGLAAAGVDAAAASGAEGDQPAAQGGGTVLFMPALLKQSADLALKIVSVFPGNVARGLPTIHALVVAVDPVNGRPLALLEGASLTAIRTGAGSGAATEALARPDAARLGIFGSGVQARTQLQAVCAVRPIEAVTVFSPDRVHAEQFAEEIPDLASRFGRAEAPASATSGSTGPAGQAQESGAWLSRGEVQVADTPAELVSQADVICAATNSSTPVFNGADLRRGTHINAIGSYTPQMQEVDLETIRRSLVVVDSREAVLAEAGDLMVPLERGEIQRDQIQAELGELLNGEHPGRTSPEQITYFKSVGLAVQDAAAAGLALRNAERLGLGRLVEL